MPSSRLREKYRKEVVPMLKDQLGCKSVMQVPKLVKICVNQGVGMAVTNKKLIDVAMEEMAAITGQKAVLRKSKKAVSNFKLRENMPIGVGVTLRGERMYEFLDRLVTLALPRVRDFRGVSVKGLDGRGNYTLGVREQLIFPEISMDQVNRVTGMNITLVTSAKDNRETYALLKAMGMPFKDSIEGE